MKTKISQAFLKKGQLVSLRLEPEYLAVGVANEYMGSCLSNCDGDFDTRCVPQNTASDSGFIAKAQRSHHGSLPGPVFIGEALNTADDLFSSCHTIGPFPMDRLCL